MSGHALSYASHRPFASPPRVAAASNDFYLHLFTLSKIHCFLLLVFFKQCLNIPRGQNMFQGFGGSNHILRVFRCNYLGSITILRKWLDAQGMLFLQRCACFFRLVGLWWNRGFPVVVFLPRISSFLIARATTTDTFWIILVHWPKEMSGDLFPSKITMKKSSQQKLCGFTHDQRYKQGPWSSRSRGKIP